MSVIKELPKVIRDAKKVYKLKRFVPFEITEGDMNDEGLLAFGDNMEFMKYLRKKEGMEGKIQLIYIDPPFFTQANYDAIVSEQDTDRKVKKHAYDDKWTEGMSEYLSMLTPRLMHMKGLLSDTGTIWVHLDWHSSHYIKVIMDEIFGEENFINEIVWTYKSGGSSKSHFARKHDVILVYSKTKKYYLNLPKEKSYNRDYKPYRFKGVEEFQDELGWYTMVNMKDVWSIDMVGRTSKERNGYATQKPEALLDRIVQAGSHENDYIADFFCGSATLGAVGKKSSRRWICCDNSDVAFETSIERLSGTLGTFRVMKEKEE